MEKWKLVNWLSNYEFKALPNIGGDYFVYKPVYQFNDWQLLFNCNVKIQDNCEDIEAAGWIVEYKLDTLSFEPWDRCKKLYETKEIAMHAILQMQRCYANYEWRVKPIYILDKMTLRNYAIYEILKDI